MSISLKRPSPGKISSPFGERIHPITGMRTTHYGIDFSWDNNGKQDWGVYAALSGTVVFRGSSGGWGNLTKIDHGSGWQTWYAHQSAFDVLVGQKVETGHRIGTIGDTGSAQGAHLHFELHKDGVPVDPMPYFAGSAGTPTGDDEMPEYTVTDLALNQELEPGKETHLYINAKKDVSFLFGPALVEEIVWLHLTGVPEGEEVQVRFVRTTVKAGQANKLTRGPLAEIVGTPGGTFGQHSDKTRLGKDDRLRVLVKAFSPGIRIEKATVKTFHWKG